MNSFKCEFCDKEYYYRNTLKRHVSADHPERLEDIVSPSMNNVPTSSYQCFLCDKDFSLKRNLIRHQSNVHGVHQQKKFTCKICSFEAPSEKSWFEHFQSVHQIAVKSEDLEFSTEKDFLDWKQETERKTCSQFVKTSGARVVGGSRTLYYACHRSGVYNAKGEGKRHLKITGSSKMDGKCPAKMKVICEEGSYQVHFVSTHIGHKLELGHINLTENERDSIARDIALGIPFQTILRKTRETLQGSNLERVHLLTMQDLHNIAATQNVGPKSVRHPNDAVSVEAWVQEVQESANPCVLFYKAQDTTNNLHPELRSEDFVLVIMNSAQCELLAKYGNDCICVDGTHGLNSYNFEVTTLLVLDDLRQGFPCAFLISNRSDSAVLSIFFEYVKSQVGQICPKVFMTDLAEAYSIAWNKTMGAPRMRLFCTWHVDKAWSNNINGKIKNKDKREEVFSLVTTLRKARNIDEFEKALPVALKNLDDDPQTSDFGEYFRTYYEKNVKSWAYCYRMQAGLNTNMHLESMHKTLKYVHCDAKQVKRVDKGISALMSLVTSKLFDRLHVNVKGKLTSKIRDIRRKHESVPSEIEGLVTTVDGGWEIPSAKSSEVYLVRENNAHCMCRLVCNKCNVCIHRYSCTCIDYSIKLNMCKHIHIVCRVQNSSGDEIPLQNEVSDALVVDEEVSTINERDAILSEISGNANRMPESLSNEKKKIIEMFSEVVAEMTADEIHLAKKMVLSLKASVTAAHIHSGSISTVAEMTPKRKLIPQRSLYSTKKRKSSRRVHMAVPGPEESHRILKSLLNECPNSTDVSPTEQNCHNTTLLQQDLQHRSPSVVSVAEENNSILCWETLQNNMPGSVSIAVEEYDSTLCQEAVQNNIPGPVSIAVEERESAGLLWQQELPHSTSGLDAEQYVSVDHNYAKPYSTAHIISTQCTNATASKELLTADQHCLEAD